MLVRAGPEWGSAQGAEWWFDVSTAMCFSHTLFSAEHMDPERAFQEQIERYRKMTGEQRLAIALELHELSCNVAREGIRYQNPNAEPAEVERLLRRRLELARQ